MAPPKIKINGVGPIPSGYFLGRSSNGTGDVELISHVAAAEHIAATGVVSKPGEAANVVGTTDRVTVTGNVIDIAATYVGQTSITTLGTISTGTWNGAVITGQYGGTGVANTGKTVTLGGNLTTSGAFAITLTATATTNSTLPAGTHNLAPLDSPVFLGIEIDANSTTLKSDAVVGQDGVPGYILSGDNGVYLQVTPATTGYSVVQIDGVGAGNFPAFLSTFSNGTVASRTAVVNNDILLQFDAIGYSDATTTPLAGIIKFTAAENWSTAPHQATSFTVQTVDTATETLSDRLTIDSLGAVIIQGTPTNNSAAAGFVGEYKTGQTNTTSMTSTVSITLASVSLTAGDWDVEGTMQLNPAAGTVTSNAKAGISTTNNTLPTAMTAGGYAAIDATTAASVSHVMQTGAQRVSLASTTTVYLVGQSTFSVSTMTGSGFIRARRVR